MATTKQPAMAQAPPAAAWGRFAGSFGRTLLWLMAAVFLLQAMFHFLQLKQVSGQVREARQELAAMQAELADWRQRAAYATTPDFLEAAVKEFTLTREAHETVIVVDPSPVPPVGDVVRQRLNRD